MGKADYPLLLRPHLAERVWGGSLLGPGIGEAWDLSVHPNGPSVIANGPLQGRTLAAVADERPDDFGGPIRLLAKRLDCMEDLSVQVHPREGDPKTEAWVVLDARPNAGVYHGFENEVTHETIRAAATDGTLPDLLRFIEVRPGQCVFVPSGTVHAIGGGLLLFEIQQSSDVTYRLFDWGRGRDLHLDEGLECCGLNGAVDALPTPARLEDGALRLVQCRHFHVDRVDTTEAHRVDPEGKWCALLMVAGQARVDDLDLEPGETLLVPQAAGPRMLEPKGTCTALVYAPE